MTTTRQQGALPEGLREIELEDALRAAQRTVAYWDAELSRRIGAAQAFDGMGGWMSKLMGSYEQDVDAAVREVQVARAQLAHAKQQVDEAQAALTAWREGRVQQADDAVAQVMAVEEAVARVKATGGPALARVEAVEAKLVVVEARRDRLKDAHEASLDLVMELSRARAAATQSRPTRVTRYEAYGGRAYAPAQGVMRTTTEGEYREVEISVVSDVALVWEEAMLGLGIDAPPQVDVAMQALLQVDGHFADPDASELRTMAAQNAVEPMVRRLKAVLDEVQAEVDALMRERAQAVGMELQ